jgi:hypothetical protein
MTYTCADYRVEMILLGLKRRAADETLSPDERDFLEAEIRKLEKTLGVDDP